MKRVLIVNADNEVVGDEDPMVAQQNGLVHRIVRLFLFNGKGELFVQKRSMHVNSSPGLFDQSVGGWVDAGETNLEAVERETEEELGITGLTFTEIGTYYSDDDTNTDGQPLKRFNILYSAVTDQALNYDPEEVAGGRWIAVADLETDMQQNPDVYTDGFRKALAFHKKQTQSS